MVSGPQDCDSGDQLIGNVFYRAGRAAFIGGGRDNLIENNVFIECENAVHIDSRGLERAKPRLRRRRRLGPVSQGGSTGFQRAALEQAISAAGAGDGRGAAAAAG